MIEQMTIEFDGKKIEVETGKMANLAGGSCTLRMGDTMILVTACSGSAREDADFFPLQVDYREKFSAAGRFPGGYMKREGRPSEKEILTCRLTDRPLRPLFPKGFYDEVQVQALLLSADGENNSDVLCMLGSSIALTLSDLPFNGPIGSLRVGRIDGKFVANPTVEEMEQSDLELIYSGIEDKVIMIEGEGDILPEQVLKDSLIFANDIVKVQIAAQKEFQARAGKTKKEPKLYLVPESIKAVMTKCCAEKLVDVCKIPGKEARINGLNALYAEAEALIKAEVTDVPERSMTSEMKKCYDELIQDATRAAILDEGYRADGRGLLDLRPLTAEIDTIPRVHGSGLFSRGETQALVIAVLGGNRDTENADGIAEPSTEKKFYLHYNFPNFSVGDVGRIGGTSRREIGHGNLAERSLKKVIPADYPYTVRLISEVMSSNGSTSMASVCGGTLALMAAGVPISAPVAGISCGLVSDGQGKELLMTDILGSEDHFGDMDFKVCGTREGFTGFQLDLKLPGVSLDLLCKAIDNTLTSRLEILDTIEGCISTPKETISQYAPQLKVITVAPDKIGAIIGTGGKNIKAMTENTGANIDISDDGSVKIFAPSEAALEEVTKMIEELTAEVEVGAVYTGKVVGIKDFGAFVEVLPGQEGLLHISELAAERINNVTDVVNEGDEIEVKVLAIEQGKIRLSHKALLGGSVNISSAPAAPRTDLSEVEVGKVYRGTVKNVKPFGAFVEILPGLDGLCHISQLADYRVNQVEDIVNTGDSISVKVLKVENGKIDLSRKEALDEI